MVERARVATGQAASVRCACHSRRTQLARMARSLDTLRVDELRWWPLGGLGSARAARGRTGERTTITDLPVEGFPRISYRDAYGRSLLSGYIGETGKTEYPETPGIMGAVRARATEIQMRYLLMPAA